MLTSEVDRVKGGASCCALVCVSTAAELFYLTAALRTARAVQARVGTMTRTERKMTAMAVTRPAASPTSRGRGD